MKRAIYLCCLMTMVMICNPVEGQNFNLSKTPKQAYLHDAKEMAKGFFDDLANKRHEKIAAFIVDNIGYTWDDSNKISNRNEYLSKLEIISLKPPKGVYGDLTGYDLIEEGFLKGSDRFFRHTYITYHEGSILVWEFRFFVKEDGKVTLHYLGWSDKNPFEYMSTPDMLFTQFNR